MSVTKQAIKMNIQICLVEVKARNGLGQSMKWIQVFFS